MASLIPTPVWVLASLNRLIFPFFWGGKVDLVARDVVIQPPDFGRFLLSIRPGESVGPACSVGWSLR